MTNEATGSCTTTPTRSARSRGRCVRVSRPSTTTEPLSRPPEKCGTSPLMQRSSVDLPAAGGADDEDQLALGDGEVDVRQAVAVVAVVPDADVVELDHGGHSARPARQDGPRWRRRTRRRRAPASAAAARWRGRPAAAGRGHAGGHLDRGDARARPAAVAMTSTAAGSRPLTDDQPLRQRPRVAAVARRASRAGRRRARPGRPAPRRPASSGRPSSGGVEASSSP